MCGVVYSVVYLLYLFNVWVGNMSVLFDDFGYFVCWLEVCGEGDCISFVFWMLYGMYFSEMLVDIVVGVGGWLMYCVGEVCVLDLLGDDGVVLMMVDRVWIDVDSVVLVFGNLLLYMLLGIDFDWLFGEVYVVDLWVLDIVDGLVDIDIMVFVGIGLIVIDVVLLFDVWGFVGCIFVIFRWGLLLCCYVDGMLLVCGVLDKL